MVEENCDPERERTDHTESDLGAGAQPCSLAPCLSLLGEFIPHCKRHDVSAASDDVRKPSHHNEVLAGDKRIGSSGSRKDIKKILVIQALPYGTGFFRR